MRAREKHYAQLLFLWEYVVMLKADEIRMIFERAGLNQASFADAIGVHQSTVSRWLKGQSTPDPQQEAQIRTIAADGAVAAGQPHIVDQPFGRPDLPVYAAVEGGPGEMVINTDPIEWVTRPWYLKAVRDGYAVLIVGESMAPVFEPGDYAIVNPRLPPIGGQDAIFTQERADGEFKATIKRMVRRNAVGWRVRQFNPPENQEPEFDLRSPPWTKAVRVVGKYYRG